MTVVFEVDRLKKEAQALKDILMEYQKQEQEAMLCLDELQPIIQHVLDGNVTQPVAIGDIPCGYQFTEGKLSSISGMMSTFSTFSNHIEGMDTIESRNFFQELDKEISRKK